MSEQTQPTPAQAPQQAELNPWQDPMSVYSIIEGAAVAFGVEQGPNGVLCWEESQAGGKVTFTPGHNQEGQPMWALRIDSPDKRLVDRFYPKPPKSKSGPRYVVTPDWPRPEELDSISFAIDPKAHTDQDRPQVIATFSVTGRDYTLATPYKYIDLVNALTAKGTEVAKPVGRLRRANYALGELAFGKRRRQGW